MNILVLFSLSNYNKKHKHYCLMHNNSHWNTEQHILAVQVRIKLHKVSHAGTRAISEWHSENIRGLWLGVKRIVISRFVINSLQIQWNFNLSENPAAMDNSNSNSITLVAQNEHWTTEIKCTASCTRKQLIYFDVFQPVVHIQLKNNKIQSNITIY
jgi:hypothetical protein